METNDLRKAAEMAFAELCNQRDAHYTKDIPTELTQAIQALRQALAQPVDAVNMSQERVDETAKREHEPVAWMYTSHYRGNEWFITHYQSDLTTYKADKVRPLYTAPPKREWVGLTQDEVEYELTKEFAQWWSRHVSVCRAIEAKLKEKNT